MEFIEKENAFDVVSLKLLCLIGIKCFLLENSKVSLKALLSSAFKMFELLNSITPFCDFKISLLFHHIFDIFKFINVLI